MDYISELVKNKNYRVRRIGGRIIILIDIN